MKRGDLVAAVLLGDFGKPRPALIVRADAFAELPTVTLLPLTTTLHPAALTRIDCAPTHKNGLRQPSQIMIDKIMTVTKAKIGAPIGQLDRDTLLAVNRAGILSGHRMTGADGRCPEAMAYEYRPIGDKDFELCAVFETESQSETTYWYTYNRNWAHGRGRHCFQLNVDDAK